MAVEHERLAVDSSRIHDDKKELEEAAQGLEVRSLRLRLGLGLRLRLRFTTMRRSSRRPRRA